MLEFLNTNYKTICCQSKFVAGLSIKPENKKKATRRTNQRKFIWCGTVRGHKCHSHSHAHSPGRIYSPFALPDNILANTLSVGLSTGYRLAQLQQKQQRGVDNKQP